MRLEMVSKMVGHELAALKDLDREAGQDPDRAGTAPFLAAVGLGRTGAIAPAGHRFTFDTGLGVLVAWLGRHRSEGVRFLQSLACQQAARRPGLPVFLVRRPTFLK